MGGWAPKVIFNNKNFICKEQKKVSSNAMYLYQQFLANTRKLRPFIWKVQLFLHIKWYIPVEFIEIYIYELIYQMGVMGKYFASFIISLYIYIIIR